MVEKRKGKTKTRDQESYVPVLVALATILVLVCLDHAMPTTRHVAMVHGLTMYVNSDDRVITAARIQVWEPVLTKLVLDTLREGDTFIDIGANIGYYSLLAARKVGARGRVVAFEPEPRAFSFLEHNVQANGFSNVVVEQKAVSNTPGVLQLYVSTGNLGDHRIFPAAERRQTVEVEAVSLDEYLNQAGAARVDFIKIDTQGAESLILEGMRGTLRRHRNARVILEFWPHGLRAAGSSGAQLLLQIRGLGFQIL